jgi:hypothetical protein
VTLAAAPRLGALLVALGAVDHQVAFDALGLDTLFVPDPARRPRLPDASRVVCWFGARTPDFARRLGDLVPGAVVAPPFVPGRLVWEHLLDTVGAPAGDWRAPIAAPASVRALGAGALAAAGMILPPPWLFVHPGAGGPGKCWAADGFARAITGAAARARMNVVVHQGPADAAQAAALRRHVGDGVVWLVEPSLPALAGALAHAHVYLGNDSGVSHLAAALGVPSLVLFDARHQAWAPWWAGARTQTVTLTAALEPEIETVTAGLLEVLR